MRLECFQRWVTLAVLFNARDIWQPPPGGELGGTLQISRYFPQPVERIAMAIMINDQQDAILNKNVAQLTYESDYQFAKAPNPPKVTAVAGEEK